MSSPKIDVVFGADTANLRAQIAAAEARFAALNAQFKAAAASAVNLNAAVGGVPSNLAQLSVQTGQARIELDRLNRELVETTVNLGGVQGGFNRLQMMETAHVARAMGDMIAAGRDPLQALVVEFGRISQIFTLGSGGVMGTIRSAMTSLAAFATPVTAAWAGVGGVIAGAAAALALYRSRQIEIADAVRSQRGAAAWFGNDSGTNAGFEATYLALKKISDLSAEDAKKVATAFAPLNDSTNSVGTWEANVVKPLAEAMGKEVPEAADKLAEALKKPETAGKDFVDAIGSVTQANREALDEAIKSDNAEQMRAAIIRAVTDAVLNQRGATRDLAASNVGLFASLHDVLDPLRLFGAQSSIAAKAVADFDKRTRDLSAATSPAVTALQNMTAAYRDMAAAAREVLANDVTSQLNVIQQKIGVLNNIGNFIPGGDGQSLSRATLANVSPQDRDMMIRTMFGEAGNEPTAGIQAVGNVIRNRVLSGKWGNSITSVVSAPSQFNGSPTDPVYGGPARNLSPDSDAYRKIGAIVDAIIEGRAKDVTGGAMNFYNPKISNPAWGVPADQALTIGGHRFVGGTVKGTLGDEFNDVRIAEAKARLEDQRQALEDKRAGGSVVDREALRIAQERAKGTADEVKDAEAKVDALKKQLDLTHELEARNKVSKQLADAEIARDEKVYESRLAIQRANLAGAETPEAKRDARVAIANLQIGHSAPGNADYVTAQQALKDAERDFQKDRAGKAVDDEALRVAKERADGARNELKDAQAKVGVLKQQVDATTDLQEKNKLLKELYDAQKDVTEKQYQTRLAEANRTLAAAQTPAQKRDAQIAVGKLEMSHSAPGNSDYVAAQQKIDEAKDAFDKAQSRESADEEDERYNAASKALQTKLDTIRQEVQMRHLTAQQGLSQEQQIEQQRADLERQHYQKLMEIWGKGTEQYSKAQKKLEEVDADSLKRRNDMALQANRSIEQSYEQTMQSASSSIGSAISGMIAGHNSLRNTVRQILGQMAQRYAEIGVKMLLENSGMIGQTVAQVVTGEGLKTAAVASGTAARTGLQGAAAATQSAIVGTGVLKSIFASAGETFAGIFGFLSPVMGPAAIGPAAAGQATVMGVATGLSSFAVGSWSLPSDMVAQVHKGEMIVPAAQTPWAQSLMANAAGGNGGGARPVSHETHLHVHAVDGQSVQRFFERNDGEIFKALDASARRGVHRALTRNYSN